MKTFWTQGMSPKDKEEFTQKFANAKDVRESLADRLRSDIKRIQKERLSADADYSENWTINQAQLNAEERVYTKIIDLIIDK